jgi:glycosyltransferase 2 family protein
VLSRAKGLFNRYFKQLALVATVIGIAVALIGQRHAIADFDWQLNPGAMAASILLFALAPIVQGFCFWLVLRSLEVPSRLDEAMVIWSRSFLLRYAPSGALALVIRVKSQDRLRASSGHIYTSFGYEQLVALLSGAVACVGAFLLDADQPPWIAIAILAAATVVAVVARPGFLGEYAQERLQRRGMSIPSIMRGRHIAAISAVNVLGWLATGAGAYLLVCSLTTTDRPAFLWLLGAYSFAWLLGFVVPLLPGGLGLRDATLVAFLTTTMGVGAATAIAIALRLANTLGEFAAIGVVEVVYQAVVRSRPARRRIGLGVRSSTDPRPIVTEESC